MSWRPKEGWDWKSIQGEALKQIPVGCHGDEIFIEAGADAMLEALKKEGIHDEFYSNEHGEVCSTAGTSVYILCGKGKENRTAGTVVFIPDEETK